MKRITLFMFAMLCMLKTFSQDKTQAVNTPEWSKNATIYEVNVRQFTPEGTFKAFQEHLPRLKKMGVDILWLMPINPIGEKNRKGSLGSYYAVKDYMAVNPEFGTKADFKTLVDAVHAQGMKIIVDWVANHTSPDNVWARDGKMGYYTLDSTGNLQPTIGTDWWDVADLNYDSQDMRYEMLTAMKYWVETFDIDGYRCDVADWVPVDFWNNVRAELDAIKPVFMLAEAENPEHHKAAFDMSYGWEFHHIMNEIAQGKKNTDAIREYMAKSQPKFPAGAYRMSFTSNHDENSWNGTEMERMRAGRYAMAVLAATFEGMPLIYNGQETSLDKRLRFFDKDTIVWKKMDLVDFYTKLNDLHHTNKALWNGAYGGKVEVLSPESNKDLFVFSREKDGQKVIVVLNLSPKKVKTTLESTKFTGQYTDLFANKKTSLTSKVLVDLDAWQYKVYVK